MAISFPITGVTAAVTASRSPAFTLGTSPVENDVIVAIISGGGAANTITTASGWVNVLGGNTIVASDAHSANMVYHIVTAAEDAANQVTWTLTNHFDGSTTGRISTAVLRGCWTLGPLAGVGSGFATGNTTTPWVIPSFQPGADSAQIVCGVTGDGTSTQTTPGSWTLQSGAGTSQSCYLYSRDAVAVSGAVLTGTTNVTPSAGDEYASIAAGFVDASIAIAARALIPMTAGQARAAQW